MLAKQIFGQLLDPAIPVMPNGFVRCSYFRVLVRSKNFCKKKYIGHFASMKELNIRYFVVNDVREGDPKITIIQAWAELGQAQVQLS